MCGVIGAVLNEPANQTLYDGLLLLQHRGQDAAGISTLNAGSIRLHKSLGLVKDVFGPRHIEELAGNIGIGHCRYATQGSSVSVAESQPFYVNSPFGLVLAHNGSLTNTSVLRQKLTEEYFRHVNTGSDSEVILNVLAHELHQQRQQGPHLDGQMVFRAVKKLHETVRGAYAVVGLISGLGLFAFRDPCGIRPLIIGKRMSGTKPEYMIASESVALEALGFSIVRDVMPGELVLVTQDYELLSFPFEGAVPEYGLYPCIFEYVYLARPDSLIDGISVYESRVHMGRFLAKKITRDWPGLEIDVVIPIPDSSRHAAMEVAQILNRPYREGFVKNRYIGRTFIMPNQTIRKKSVRQKLNAISQEFKGKKVLLIDDSIVRGTTSEEIILMARESGSEKVYFASASPPIRFQNVYGICMPTKQELIAFEKTVEQIKHGIGADELIYQDLEDLVSAVSQLDLGASLKGFETSCFSGKYMSASDSEGSEYLSSFKKSFQLSVTETEENESSSHALHTLRK